MDGTFHPLGHRFDYLRSMKYESTPTFAFKLVNGVKIKTSYEPHIPNINNNNSNGNDIKLGTLDLSCLMRVISKD
jgi:hypothetical protein